ncbi:hypothetical protein [Actinobacillus equuli]|uniref:hypothetical protein n=1 Tax=Actinobacillus equuli TaxID=718 RepID=UPI0024435E70|nr:hypothetical protein [Actinobacillus equuli]WGE75341.1 hypothetical protein NYR81_10615 [Actinobacillus equuli subsp. haemolyticus]
MSKVANVLSQAPKTFSNLNLQFQQGLGKIKSGVQKGYQSSKQHLSQVWCSNKKLCKQAYLIYSKRIRCDSR